MPLYEVNHATNLTASQKSDLATALTTLHSTRFSTPRLFVNVKFTDIDYNVFSDAAKFMQAGESPYARATYRYTPILAWLLIPNQYLANWGKIVFSAGDILAGWLMI